ncbi:MAG: outer membrane lipoprotein-sorting protein [Myxococcota bacterium]
MHRALSVLILLCGLAEASSALETPQEILACMSRNEPERSTVQALALRSVDRSGSENTSRATLYWRRQGDRSDLVLRFLEPADLKGAALLVRERASGEEAELYLYLPELGQTRRVSGQASRGGLFGTNFTFEDIERLYGIAHYGELERLPDSETAGRKVYVVEGQPAPEDDSAYERVVFHVDAQTCVPLRIDLFEVGDRLRKSMLIDPEKIHVRGPLHVPGSIVLNDLRAESSSSMTIEEITFDASIPGEAFTPERLSGSE